MKNCIACGMPMKNPSDFAISDITKDYCKFCARLDGTMQSYDEKLKALSDFISLSQEIDIIEAEALAKKTIAKLPAWQ